MSINSQKLITAVIGLTLLGASASLDGGAQSALGLGGVLVTAGAIALEDK